MDNQTDFSKLNAKSYAIFLLGILLIPWLLLFFYLFIDSFFVYNLWKILLYFILSSLTLALDIILFRKHKDVLYSLKSKGVIAGILVSISGGYGYLYYSGTLKFYLEYASFPIGYKTQPLLAYLCIFSYLFYFFVIGILLGAALQFMYKKYFPES